MKTNTKPHITLETFLTAAGFAISVILVILSIIILSSCATQKPASVQTARTDTIVKVILRVDSIRVTEHTSSTILRHDSIAPILDPQGNVTGWDRFHTTTVTNDNSREIAHLNSVIDSLRSVRANTVFIRQPPPDPAEAKPATLSAWQEFQIRSFWPLILALAAAIIYIFRRPILRLLCRLRL